MSNIISHYKTMYPLLSPHGEIYIAGGSIRDHLLHKTPRDYDFFILNHKSNKDDIKNQMYKQSWYASFEDAKKSVVSSSPYVIRNITLNGDCIQIIYSKHKTINDLLHSFDWNICQFAYNGNEIIQQADIKEIFTTKTIKLVKRDNIPNYVSCLRRGFIFSDRYNIYMDKSDLGFLCEEVYKDYLIKQVSSI